MINLTNSSSEVASIINQALEDAGSSVTVGNESGLSVSGKLNEVFGADLLDDSQSGSEWSQAVEDGFDSLEPQPSIDAVVKFLHVSDPHGYSAATTQAKTMLANDSDIAFLFVTGDMTAYGRNGISSGLAADFSAIGDRLLMLAGNHDTYENNFGTQVSQRTTTNYIKSMLNNRVVWGDQTGVASYWYKDIQLSGNSKLRIISLDQYEIDVMNRFSIFYTMYSQAQINWFIARLKELTANDYVIVATHEPPVQNQSNTDQYAQEMAAINGNPQKLFMTNYLLRFGSRGSEPNINLLPRIMRAYMHKQPLVLTYNNIGGNAISPDITISEDFSRNEPATFLFWLGGHQHADICYYLPDEINAAKDGGDWGDQLMLYITAADRDVEYATFDDLGGKSSELPAPTSPSAEKYRINEVELDFAHKAIKLTRHGDRNTSSGRVRDQITFPFKKGGTT